jgi:precorrin-2 dehydrogenase/sirohydrochlorin ferrochelatase
MAHYPINLDLRNRRCLVVGGGSVAERKVETLLEFGAEVTVVAPELTPSLSQLASSNSIRHIPASYTSDLSDLSDYALVFAATDDREVNKRVSADCQSRGILVNVVDDPELCTFFVLAIVQREDLIISISTSGRSPAMARWLRERLEASLGPEYGQLADILGDLRSEVKAKYPDPADRNQAYLRILNSDVLTLLSAGKEEEALTLARSLV